MISLLSNLLSIEKYFDLFIIDYSNYVIDKSISGSLYFFWLIELW